MSFEVTYGIKWFVTGEGYGLGHGESDKHAAQKSRSRCCRNAVEGAESNSRFFQGFRDEPVEMVDMRPSGNFGNDPARGCMVLELR